MSIESNIERETRDLFIEIGEELLAGIDAGGWGFILDADVRPLFDALAQYAMQLGFDHPPVSFHVHSDAEGDSLGQWFGSAACQFTTIVEVSLPWMKNVVTEEFQNGAFWVGCHLPHCEIFNAIRAWIDTVASLPDREHTVSDVRPKHKRGIDDARAYELYVNKKMTLKAVGKILANEQGRPDPYKPQSVRQAVERHEETRAKAGLQRRSRSLGSSKARPLRNDD